MCSCCTYSVAPNVSVEGVGVGDVADLSRAGNNLATKNPVVAGNALAIYDDRLLRAATAMGIGAWPSDKP